MIEITLEDFKKLKNKHGFIFMFTIDYCGGCKKYFDGIKDEKLISNYIKVNANNEEELMEIDIEALPCTIIFDRDGAIKWKKYGILFDKQLDELRECLK